MLVGFPRKNVGRGKTLKLLGRRISRKVLSAGNLEGRWQQHIVRTSGSEKINWSSVRGFLRKTLAENDENAGLSSEGCGKAENSKGRR